MNGITKNQSYDILKVLTQILVVTGHACRMYVGDGAFTPTDASALLRTVSLYLYGFHMPLYFLLSGAVYGCGLSAGKYQNRLRFLLKKLVRLMIPYLFFGLFYVGPVLVLTGLTDSYTDFCLNAILKGGNSRHLWFLLALLWIFVMAVLVQPLIYKTPVLVIALSLGVCFLSCYLYVGSQVTTAMYEQLYFFGGIYLNLYFDKIANFLRRCRGLLAIPAGLAVFGYLYYPNWPFTPVWAWAGILAAFSLVLGLEPLMARFVKTRFYTWSLKNCFGIYLFHPMLIYLAYDWLGSRSVPPLLFCPAVIVLSYALSGLLTSAVRRLHLGILIGESSGSQPPQPHS